MNESSIFQANEKGLPGVDSHAMVEIEMDESGLIQNCSDQCEPVFGFKREELLFRHISVVIRLFSSIPPITGGRLNSHIDFICHCDMPFEVRKKGDNGFLLCRLNIVTRQHPQIARFKLLVNPLLEAA